MFVAVIAVFIACFTFVLSTQTIELPKDFCEVDRRNECKKNQCVRYDPKKFMSSPSLVTYFPNGRLGNKLTAYLTLLWIGLETGLEVLYEKESFKVLDHYFENINLPVLEDSLCDWRQFPFKKYEGNMELLGRPEWATGQAIQLFIDKSNFMRHEIQGGRQYYKKYRTESLRALTFRKNFRDHANKILSEIAKKVEQDSDAKVELTFVGIHNRRTDYLEFRKRRLGLDNLYEDYFQVIMCSFSGTLSIPQPQPCYLIGDFRRYFVRSFNGVSMVF